MQGSYRLVAHDKPGLLFAMMKFFVENAKISFEGDLKFFNHKNIPGASFGETKLLKRNTLIPIQDFIIIPLENETISDIIHEITPKGRLVSNIIHIQIEKEEKLVFTSYDHFHHECIGCTHEISEDFLMNLKTKGIIKSFKLYLKDSSVRRNK